MKPGGLQEQAGTNERKDGRISKAQVSFRPVSFRRATARCRRDILPRSGGTGAPVAEQVPAGAEGMAPQEGAADWAYRGGAPQLVRP